MTQCTCTCRGFCPVLGVAVTEQLRQVCIKDHAKAVKVAEAIKVDRARQVDDCKEQRRKKVEEATRRKKRLVSWLKLFRADSEKGIGDTAARLLKQKKKSPIYIASDAHNAVNCLLKQCSCSRVDAVAKLNQQWPY